MKQKVFKKLWKVFKENFTFENKQDLKDKQDW
jgi:hypothetical protein